MPEWLAAPRPGPRARAPPADRQSRAPAHRVFNSLSFLVFLAVCVGLLSFEDSPTRARFECPDGSHLDSRSAPGFNRLLGEELSRQLPGALAAPLP